jgi:hypothetical protein
MDGHEQMEPSVRQASVPDRYAGLSSETCLTALDVGSSSCIVLSKDSLLQLNRLGSLSRMISTHTKKIHVPDSHKSSGRSSSGSRM